MAIFVFPICANSQEEPEAKYIKNKYEFVDSIPFVRVNADKPQWKISKYLNGSHFVYAFENDSLYLDDRIAKWMKDSKTGIIRWPGGTVVQYYHWDDLNGIPFKNDSWAPDYHEAKEPAYKFMDLDEYVEFCKRANVEPMVGINIRSGKAYNKLQESLNEAKRLIEYCKRKNYNVKHWYIGNEGYAKGFSAKKYADYIDMYAKVLKEVDPKIEIIGDWKMGPYKKNRFEGSIEIASNSNEIDVLEFHEKWGVIWGLKSGFTFEEWQKEYPIYDGKLGMHIQRFKEAMRKSGKEVKVGFNEWGLGEIEGGSPFSYSLVAADYLIELYKNDVYEACYWNLNIGEENSRVLKTNTKNNKLEKFNPISKVFVMLSDALGKEYLYVDSNAPFLYGFGAKDPDTGEIFLYLINKSEKDIPIKMGLFGLDLNNKNFVVEEFVNPGIIKSKKLLKTDFENGGLTVKSLSFNKITIRPKN